jgi:hypothetical protein
MKLLSERLRLYVIPDPIQGRGLSLEEQAGLALEGGATAKFGKILGPSKIHRDLFTATPCFGMNGVRL